MCSGRTYADSPEIDGTVYFTGAARPGDMVVCLGAGTISAWANALPGKLMGQAA